MCYFSVSWKFWGSLEFIQKKTHPIVFRFLRGSEPQLKLQIQAGTMQSILREIIGVPPWTSSMKKINASIGWEIVSSENDTASILGAQTFWQVIFLATATRAWLNVALLLWHSQK